MMRGSKFQKTKDRNFVLIRAGSYGNKILYKNLKFFDKAVEDFVTLLMGKKSC